MLTAEILFMKTHSPELIDLSFVEKKQYISTQNKPTCIFCPSSRGSKCGTCVYIEIATILLKLPAADFYKSSAVQTGLGPYQRRVASLSAPVIFSTNATTTLNIRYNKIQ